MFDTQGHFLHLQMGEVKIGINQQNTAERHQAYNEILGSFREENDTQITFQFIDYGLC